jgi:hypothetical protein
MTLIFSQPTAMGLSPDGLKMVVLTYQHAAIDQFKVGGRR